MSGRRAPPIVRLMEKTRRDPETGCLVWLGAGMGSGYGKFQADPSVGVVGVHRWLYEYHHGPVGDLEVHHTCRNRRCVEIGHLKAVTRAEHMRLDGNATKAVCPKCGGEYTVETGIWRRCIPCKIAYHKKFVKQNPQRVTEYNRRAWKKEKARATPEDRAKRAAYARMWRARKAATR